MLFSMFKGANMEEPANKISLLIADALMALAFLLIMYGAPLLVFALEKL